jgi:hypothetical protein
MTTTTTKPVSTETITQSTAAARAPIVLTPDQIAAVAGGKMPTGGRTTTGYLPTRNGK